MQIIERKKKKKKGSDKSDSCFTLDSELANCRLWKQMVNRQTVNFTSTAPTDRTYLMFRSAFTSRFDLN